MQKTPNFLVAIRCRAANADVHGAIKRLSPKGDLRIHLSINSNDPKDWPTTLPFVHWTEETIENRGLLAPSNAGWRCGDYNFFMLASKFPNYDYYWLIEDDVIINRANPSSLFYDCMDLDQDVLAYHYSDAKAGWRWTDTVSPFYGRAKVCVLPLIRLSSRFVAAAMKERQRLTTLFKETRKHINDWPNDESFIASFAHHSNASIKPLESIDQETSRATMRTNPAFHQHDPRLKDFDNRTYHPVLKGKRFVTKLEKNLKGSTNTDFINSICTYAQSVAAHDPDLKAALPKLMQITAVLPVRENARMKAQKGWFIGAYKTLTDFFLTNPEALTPALFEEAVKLADKSKPAQDILPLCDAVKKLESHYSAHLCHRAAHHLEKRGLKEKAKAFFIEALQRNPRRGSSARGYILISLEHENLDEASKSIQLFLKDYPSHKDMADKLIERARLGLD